MTVSSEESPADETSEIGVELVEIGGRVKRASLEQNLQDFCAHDTRGHNSAAAAAAIPPAPTAQEAALFKIFLNTPSPISRRES